MAYIPIPLSPGTEEHIEAIVRSSLELYLEEVHWLMATAYPERGPKRHFQFSIATTLLCVIAGASELLDQRPGRFGEKFKRCLMEHYPWSQDPPEGAVPHSAANILYEVFRNPLVHTAGVRSKGRRVKIGSILRGTEDAEARVAEIETVPDRPFSKTSLKSAQIKLCCG